ISPESPYPGLDCEEGPMRTIPVNFFVYKNKEGTDWLANVSTLDQGIDLMNSVYNPSGINFTRANIVYVDMIFPNVTDEQSSEPIGNKTNGSGADDGDNVAISQLGDGFVEGYEPTMSNIVLMSDGWGAYSLYPWHTRDHYVSFVRASTFGTSYIPSHEVGHHLGLYHTHQYYDSLGSDSDLDRAPSYWVDDWVIPDEQCYRTGDFICDTPYDCYRWCEEVIDCNASDLYEGEKPGQQESEAPQCTEEQHNPSLVNLMSRYGDRSEITEDQGARARYFIQFMMDNNRNGNQLVLYES
ncbi:MAG: hypothetical protein NZ802_05535, partial [Candidatus Poseidoniales archaeon]|nr:hypothetical protein [Candidatus Poseidoniales archaeon]